MSNKKSSPKTTKLNIDSIALPSIIIDADSKIMESNKLWQEHDYANDIVEFKTFEGSEDEKTISPKQTKELSFHKTKIDDGKTLISFLDTEKISDKQGNTTAIAHLYIDNYEEAFEEVQGENVPLIKAVIERKLSEFAKNINAVLQKTEKDKFLMIFSETELDGLVNNKFDILEQIKKISFGNKIPITLCIGVGLSKKSLLETLDNARSAVNLALGRGGDQAVIKNEDVYQFFGGGSKSIEKNTRVKARVKAYAFEEMINSCDEIIIMGHKNPDYDCIGAALGVYRIAKAYDKNAHIVLEKSSPAIELIYNQIMEIPEYSDLFIDHEKSLKMITESSLLVVVDTNRPGIVEYSELLDESSHTILFDHHRQSQESITNLVLTYHEPSASSTSELICEMLQYSKKTIKLTELEADALLAGISLDTKNFTLKTGTKTFEAAAFLQRKGADTTRVKVLFKTSLEELKSINKVVDNAEIYRDIIALSVADDSDDEVIVAAKAADALLNVVGIEASFVFAWSEEKQRSYVSARSFDSINVQVITEKLGGGGHRNVAAAQLNDTSVLEAIEKVKVILDEILKD